MLPRNKANVVSLASSRALKGSLGGATSSRSLTRMSGSAAAPCAWARLTHAGGVGGMEVSRNRAKSLCGCRYRLGSGIAQPPKLPGCVPGLSLRDDQHSEKQE